MSYSATTVVQNARLLEREFCLTAPPCNSAANLFLLPPLTSFHAMADNEELIDYEEDQDVTTTTTGASAPAAAQNGAAAAPTGAADGDKKNFTGIHSTGFRCALRVFHLLLVSDESCRDFLLKPELLRAISDLGFEHPSEGMRKPI